MDNPGTLTVAKATTPPPEVEGVALDSAIIFFKDVAQNGFPSREARKHGIWFLYTVNSAVKFGELQIRSLEPLPVVESVKDIAQQGLAACDAAMLQMQTTGDGETTAQAVDVLAILRIIQFVMQILRQFPFFGGGGGENGNGGIVI